MASGFWDSGILLLSLGLAGRQLFHNIIDGRKVMARLTRLRIKDMSTFTQIFQVKSEPFYVASCDELQNTANSIGPWVKLVNFNLALESCDQLRPAVKHLRFAGAIITPVIHYSAPIRRTDARHFSMFHVFHSRRKAGQRGRPSSYGGADPQIEDQVFLSACPSGDEKERTGSGSKCSPQISSSAVVS